MCYWKYNGFGYGKLFWKCIICDRIITTNYGERPKNTSLPNGENSLEEWL